MRNPRSTLALALASLMAAAPLSAQQVIDQNQPIASGGFATLNGGASGQSFMQSGANISGLGVFIRSINGNAATSPVVFTLYDAVPTGSNTPTVLASGSVNTTLAAGVAKWVDFLFTPYAITPGTSLFFSVTGTSGGFRVEDAFDVAGAAYVPGQAYLQNAAGNFANPQYDLAFRTYTTLAQPTLAPEPASLTLLATGLVGIAGAARRRTKA